MKNRRFVVHEYHDHAQDSTDSNTVSITTTNASFPLKLHSILSEVEKKGWEHIASWAKHGRCFRIHNPDEFVRLILPRYFHQSKLTSFQRQLNLYNFTRLTRGPDKGSYYHEYFLRGRPSLIHQMVRVKVKGTGVKAASSPEQEPNLYSFPFMAPGASKSPILTTSNNPDDSNATKPQSDSSGRSPIESAPQTSKVVSTQAGEAVKTG